MKAINYFVLITILSLNVDAAFTEPELSQLEEINTRYTAKTEKAKNNLGFEIKKSIKNLPEEKENILNLERLWGETIKEKCRLAILESSGTDAEIAKKNECLSVEYNNEAEFFRSIY